MITNYLLYSMFILPLSLGAFYLWLMTIKSVKPEKLDVYEESTRAESEDSVETAVENVNYTRLKQIYLFAYLSATFADWLQGPFIYALYESYGYSKAMNGLLFIFGFGSSMLFGTIVGSMGDVWGRKKTAILYTILFILSCITKHFNIVIILIIGRVFGGMATSTLFSSFEAWVTCEYNGLLEVNWDSLLVKVENTQLPPLSNLFYIASFSNSIIAIISGLIAQFTVDLIPNKIPIYYDTIFLTGGYLCPFDIAIFVLIFCALYISFYWKENFVIRDEYESAGLEYTGSTVLLRIGIVVSCFEGAMFLFIFLWTPTLTSEGPISLGIVFALFMAMAMVGSLFFEVLSRWFILEDICRCLLFLTFCLYFGLYVFHNRQFITFIIFLLLEFAIGVYFPMIWTIKAKYTPEDNRCLYYSLFRIPLNAIVILSLILDVSIQNGFLVTTCLLFIALISWTYPSKTSVV